MTLRERLDADSTCGQILINQRLMREAKLREKDPLENINGNVCPENPEEGRDLTQSFDEAGGSVAHVVAFVDGHKSRKSKAASNHREAFFTARH